MSSDRISKRISLHVLRLFLLFLLLLSVPASRCAAQYDDDYISYDDFYQNLAPYGQWIEDPQYGYVWSPGEDGNFRPYYTNGHWVMTEYGNTWVSGYSWGWACFHYGTWTYDEYYGWLWIPGNYWGPAWVTWRYGNGFYGWAPLGPDYRPSVPISNYNCPGDWWVFIPTQYIYSDGYYQYWNGPHSNSKIIVTTRVVTNTFDNGNVRYFTGPHIAEVKQVTGNPVQVFKVRNSRNLNTRVHNDVVRMYRPSEIRQTPRVGGRESTPPDVVVAPRPVRQPQSVNTNADAPPPFRTMINNQRTNEAVTPGTNINQTAEPQRPPSRRDNNPYEWDVTRPVKQDVTPPPRTKRNTQPAKPPAPPRQPAPVRPAPPRPATPPAPPAQSTPTETPQRNHRESQPSQPPAQNNPRPGGRR
jgi:hypothetical protein